MGALKSQRNSSLDPCGIFLSDQDVEGLKVWFVTSQLVPIHKCDNFFCHQTFVADLLVKKILPQMERKLSDLAEKVSLTTTNFKNKNKKFSNQKCMQVAATRKGFRNQVKLFFGKRDNKAQNSGEVQVRQLADLSFLFQVRCFSPHNVF